MGTAILALVHLTDLRLTRRAGLKTKIGIEKMKEILEQIKDTIMLLHQMVLSGESTDGTATKMAKQAIKNIDEFLSTEQARSVVEPEVMPNEVIGGGQWLELKDFLPIDIEMVKKITAEEY